MYGYESVADPPLFLAAPAPEVRGPGVDYGSDQIGSAPALDSGQQKNRLRLHPKSGGFGSATLGYADGLNVVNAKRC